VICPTLRVTLMPTTDIDNALKRLHRAAGQLRRRATFMEVCGTHTMSAFRSGLHSLMPDNVRLLSGPGCPVCVTAQSDIDMLVDLAMLPNVTLCTYGDMLRVPGRDANLETARSRGADIHIVYSAIDAVKLAAQHPQRQVVFASVGFETTAPASAVAVLRAQARKLDNFTILASHKRVLPAMLAIVQSDQLALDGFLCPGHVSIVIGCDAYQPIVRDHHLPCVIAGFEEAHMIPALAILTELARDGEARLVNLYFEAVSPQGNRVAQQMLDRVFEIAAVRWRGLGVIPDSGLQLRSEYQHFDARHRFGLTPPVDREPRGCLCGQIIMGAVDPVACPLFGGTCTPVHPIGPCMVSSEGTCAAWFKYGRPGFGHRVPGAGLSISDPSPEARNPNAKEVSA